ncbi:hypothetical protein HJC23_000189 [Cyclotella cryptica]|uniref:Peptidase M14 carboxypeptidase A domain-containing protein n=1 Tax=Cyclotella cryptica TaxID=29204 RepID=A0ABD3QD15_9STRA|eukprot:CCRYP_006369-RA/>CCRYP_006369-RA protein AED:0.14 eAED:0.14 QI:0/-1/0/1/-1/1/1/0/554
MISRSSILHQILHVLSIAAIAHILWIYTIDTPKAIYHCPLDRYGLAHYWIEENCYWSSSYAEAREKFVSLGNVLREQLLMAREKNETLDVVHVKSISYDVSDKDTVARHGSYKRYMETIQAFDTYEFQTTVPGIDTIDVMLITLRIPSNDNRDNINIIHSSGVHGVEGYLGSAIQLRFLHELIIQNEERLDSRKDALSKETKLRHVLIIHAVNPYGMRHHRRTNENNVDLNRNALSAEEWKLIRFRDPNFEGYVDLDSVLNPFSPVTNGELFSWVRAARHGGFEGDMSTLKQRDDEVQRTLHESRNESTEYNMPAVNNPVNAVNDWIAQIIEISKSIPLLMKAMLSVGYARTKRTLVSSQYLKQCGSQYGGGAHKYHSNDWENSIYALQHAIEHFAGFPMADPDWKVFWIDVHTGLGRYGEYSMLSSGRPKNAEAEDNASKPEWVRRLATLLRDSMGMDKSANDRVSKGYEVTRGFVNGEELCPLPHCFSKTQEFGTRPGVMVGMCMVLENKGYQVGGRDFAFSTSWAFNPRRLSWRRKTLRGGVEMLQRAFNF